MKCNLMRGTLEFGLILEAALDPLNPNRVDRLRLVLTDQPTEPAEKGKTRRRK
jgi:hypothetical protein